MHLVGKAHPASSLRVFRGQALVILTAMPKQVGAVAVLAGGVR
jgi:hypothetical protein